MSGKVQTTCRSDDIGTCPEKKVQNSGSGKCRTSLHLIKEFVFLWQWSGRGLTGFRSQFWIWGELWIWRNVALKTGWRQPNSEIYSQNVHFGLLYDIVYQFIGMDAKKHVFCQQCHPSMAPDDANIASRNASMIHTYHLFVAILSVSPVLHFEKMERPIPQTKLRKYCYE